MLRKIGRWLPKIVAALLLTIVAPVCTILLVRAFDARRMPDLQPWHRVALDSEFRASDDDGSTTLEEYLRVEAQLFAELDEKVHARVVSSPELQLSRYLIDGLNNPRNFPKNWNRTFELIPEKIEGGALLLHGLTDSPYSLRRVGEILHDEGYYVLGLRLPGHGTVPAALLSATPADWIAATRIGARHVRRKVGARAAFLIVGYSNGGTLAVDYALAALEEDDLARPDRLVLFSPAIGLSPFARLSGWHRVLSFIPYFEKFRWLGIEPEYDPYKYNSFPKIAGLQSHRMTRMLSARLERASASGRLSAMPPMLTFKSLADSTIRTEAIDELYDRLKQPDGELVIFDANRLARIRSFYRVDPERLLRRLEQQPDLPYRLTVITNEDARSRQNVARSRPARSDQWTTAALGIGWPQEVYSLSHVALTFPPDDPIYGIAAAAAPDYGLALGALEPRGEKQLLLVPAERFLRLRHNPFFPYVERRLIETARATVRDAEATGGEP